MSKPTRIRVYLWSEDPSSALPSHSASRSLAALMVSAGAALWACPEAIRLTTAEDWRGVKARVRGAAPAKSRRARAIADWRSYDSSPNLDLSYPAPDGRTVRHPHAAFLRECMEARKRKKILRKKV